MIKRGSIVTIHYVLSDEHGNIIDSSHQEGPWTFVFGFGEDLTLAVPDFTVHMGLIWKSAL